ncbi:hypothetical protein IJJ49_00620 [Candidatus Saccharibacteria bacterium]|nr:hypothetical protein [Candidatus Saccharibacteria bacterium]
MKRTHKRILGFFGLTLVAITTVFAASLPTPEANAVTTLTDTISVRVVGAVPDVNLISPEPGSEMVSPSQTIAFDYENVETVTITLKYTDVDGNEYEYILQTYDTDYEAGSITYNLDLSEANYGYGEYVVTISGDGFDGVKDEDSLSFSYYPIVAESREDEDTGLIYVDLEYEGDDGTGTGEVAKIEINVYDEDGNLVTPLSPITVTPPETSVEIPFSDYDLPSGTYKIEVVAYDDEDNELYRAYTLYIVYEAIPVPDTGALFKNLNIAQADYLITGLIAFFAFGLFGIFFIAKKQKKSSRRR